MDFKTEAPFQSDSYIDVKSQVREAADGGLIIEGLASDWA